MTRESADRAVHSPDRRLPSSPMPPSAADAIEAAQRRLSGQLVETPVIGGLSVPGVAFWPELRVKAEVLQPAGSVYFRGALHYLLRQLGALKGLAVHGAPRWVLAAATAAAMLRTPCVALPVGPLDDDLESLLRATGCELRPQATSELAEAEVEQLRARHGSKPMPALAHADVADGIATLGLELAAELADDTEVVAVAPAVLAPIVARGLVAGGRALAVQGVEVEPDGDWRPLSRRLRTGLRLDVGAASVAAVQWALAHAVGTSACIVLAE